jgi:hypothetical protein
MNDIVAPIVARLEEARKNLALLAPAPLRDEVEYRRRVDKDGDEVIEPVVVRGNLVANANEISSNNAKISLATDVVNRLENTLKTAKRALLLQGAQVNNARGANTLYVRVRTPKYGDPYVVVGVDLGWNQIDVWSSLAFDSDLGDNYATPQEKAYYAKVKALVVGHMERMK